MPDQQPACVTSRQFLLLSALALDATKPRDVTHNLWLWHSMEEDRRVEIGSAPRVPGRHQTIERTMPLDMAFLPSRQARKLTLFPTNHDLCGDRLLVWNAWATEIATVELPRERTANYRRDLRRDSAQMRFAATHIRADYP
ncbi:hypothetical protein BO85DRAFT_232821 [Aspergillus piperis CBS 112811]|uniref:Uncharacterized protein n=1 Tax=Aspergillus piperis CBS 112811 TaxID=1448313 RepID=A0A8G1R6Q1_9EURO|nr:hypothetical protein BO85DRAFT_232821 [Aspergillus piperis CBS 112811]RAH60583.1 hypothetical protein BO85DRAFT_232821 [Aspergillus piperis CBS 112811]